MAWTKVEKLHSIITLFLNSLTYPVVQRAEVKKTYSGDELRATDTAAMIYVFPPRYDEAGSVVQMGANSRVSSWRITFGIQATPQSGWVASCSAFAGAINELFADNKAQAVKITGNDGIMSITAKTLLQLGVMTTGLDDLDIEVMKQEFATHEFELTVLY